MSEPTAYLYEVDGWTHREARINPKRPLPDGWIETPLFALSERELDEGRFSEWPTEELAAQCRWQARHNLDPEYSQFMMALAARLTTPKGAERS